MSAAQAQELTARPVRRERKGHALRALREAQAVDSPTLRKFQPQIEYPYSKVIEAASASLVDHNMLRVSRNADIPSTTLHTWQKSQWWEPLLEELRTEYHAEMDAAYSGLVMKSLVAIDDRLDNGDWIPTRAGPVRCPVSALALARVHGIIFDKRQLLRRQPTSIRTSDGMGAMAGALDAYLRDRESQLVSTQPAALPSSDPVTDV